MISTDMPAFMHLLTTVGLLYGKAMNEPLVEIYWRSLQRFDIAAVKTALQAHLNDVTAGQYMPKPADILRYLQGSHQTQAMKAWTQVQEAIRRLGSYRSVVFDDPIVHAVIMDMGGWIKLCSVTERELPFRANEFENRYQAYLLHSPQHYPKRLMGRVEQHNTAQGYPSGEPTLIGNREKALNVYRDGCNTSPLQITTHLPIFNHEETTP